MPINACGPMKRNPGVGSVVYAEQTSRVLIEGRVARGEGGGCIGLHVRGLGGM